MLAELGRDDSIEGSRNDSNERNASHGQYMCDGEVVGPKGESHDEQMAKYMHGAPVSGMREPCMHFLLVAGRGEHETSTDTEGLAPWGAKAIGVAMRSAG